MKAKIVIYKGKKEIFLENGTSYMAKEKETQDKFISRVKEEASLDVGDIDLTELDVIAVKSLDIAKLRKAKPTSKGLVLEIITDQIKKIIADGAAATTVPASKTKVEKVAKAKVEKVAKVAKVAAPKPTYEEAEIALELAKLQIGKKCHYLPAKATSSISATVKSASIDKRNNKVYFFLVREDKTTGFAVVGNKSINFVEVK